MCITFNLQSQYELYLTRTWSPTAAVVVSHQHHPGSTLSSSMRLMELSQSAGVPGSFLHNPAAQSVVYECPPSSASVTANPQLNIQLPQYYRHSTIGSCAPPAAAANNTIITSGRTPSQLAPQIILSRDLSSTTTDYYGTYISTHRSLWWARSRVAHS